MKRILSGFFLASTITFVLFVFMAFLVQLKAEFEAGEEYIPIEIGIVKPESDLQSKKRKIKPKPPPPKKPPPPEKVRVQDNDKVVQNMDFQMTNLNVNLKGDGPFLGKGGVMNDGDAIPLMITEPRWPRKALMEGIEGFVRLCFTILPDGKAAEVQVKDSNPRRLFDRTAQRAVYKWKFKPSVVDGVAVEQKNMCYTMEFKLEE
ncbi:MAG: energy transducer TonB [Gammaproteobacteria bacterium]|nr:energy transducer TonB [Gammaproteobacteria bacterium]